MIWKKQITLLVFFIWILSATDASKTYDDGYCPICYDKNITRVEFLCGHVVCHDCLLEYYFEQEKYNCHICRSRITRFNLLLKILKQRDLTFIKKLLMQCPEYLDWCIEKSSSPMWIPLVSNFLRKMKVNSIKLKQTIEENGNLEKIKKLLEDGANPNCDSILEKVLIEERFNIAKLLIQYGCDVNKENFLGTTPFYTFVESTYGADLGLLHFFLKHGADPNLKMHKDREDKNLEFYPIYYIVDPDAAELMLKYGAKIDDFFEEGDSLLMEMCRIMNFPMVKFYVNAGLEINRKNDLDNTPLGIALGKIDESPKKVKEIVQFLLEKGANPNALYAPQIGMSVFLLTGIKPKDNTLLQYVIKKKQWKMVKDLLFYGADPFCQNSDDKNAFDVLDENEMFFTLKRGKDYKKLQILKEYVNTLKRKRNK